MLEIYTECREGTDRAIVYIVDMFVCCLASLVFLHFPFFWGEIEEVWKRKTRIGCSANGAWLISSEPGPLAIKDAFYITLDCCVYCHS